jgi:uncharacterized protein
MGAIQQQQQDLPLGLSALEARMSALPAECDVMLLSELDGFLTGIVVCPDLIPPVEWLPYVWGGGDPEVAEGCAFADTEDFNAFCKLVIAHYNDIVRDLQRGQGHFAPFYDVDGRNDDVLWEIWLSGFTEAMALRPRSWEKVVRSNDDDAATALATLIALTGFSNDDAAAVFTEQQLAEIIPMAADMIPFCIEKLHDWCARRERGEGMPLVLGPKIGRNEPCPCESGRKYKVCCGAN